jgi:hypothetical protein
LWHAEQVFKADHLRRLREHIIAKRKDGKLLRVPVTLTLNRLPCRAICAPVIAELNRGVEFAFKVRATSASISDTREAHIESIRMMLDAGVDVSVFSIHGVIRDKLEEIKATTRLSPEDNDKWLIARNMIVPQGQSEELKLRRMIAESSKSRR